MNQDLETLTARAELQARAQRHGFAVRGLTDIDTLKESKGVVFYPSDSSDPRSCVAFPNATEASIWLSIRGNK